MKKIKIIGIVLVVFLVALAALLTSLVISGRNSGKSSSYKISEEAGMGGAGYGMPEMDGGFMKERSAVPSPNMGMQSADNLAMETAPAAPDSPDRRVIKNGDLSIKVDRLSPAQEKISAIAKNNSGDIFSSNIYQSKNNIKSGIIIVKVPVANFEKTFDEIKMIASLVLRESVSGTDVTEQYQDIETRIKNKQVEEEAYKNILAQAQKVSDILEVTEALSRVRGEIESYQGTLKYLASQTDMATISVNLSEDQDITVTDSWRPLQIAKDAVNSLVKLVQGFASFLIVLVVTFIPVAVLYLLVVFLVYLIVRKIYRKFRKNKTNDLPPSQN